jgi:hypothetical protein
VYIERECGGVSGDSRHWRDPPQFSFLFFSSSLLLFTDFDHSMNSIKSMNVSRSHINKQTDRCELMRRTEDTEKDIRVFDRMKSAQTTAHHNRID